MQSILFNPSGNDNDLAHRQAFGGNTTNLIQLNNVRYKWATQLYQQMRNQFWIPQKYDLASDVNDYARLLPEERHAFNGTLSFLVFLDSIQVSNIPHLHPYVTAPEIKICITEQMSHEALHSSSYQYIIETIIPEANRESIYEFWRSDSVLKRRCEIIAQEFELFNNNPTEENYFKALIADYVLEGLYFYQGFIFFYSLASRGLMSGVADIISAINFDELSHVRLYQKLIEESKQYLPFDEGYVYDLFTRAVDSEIEWNTHILGDRILGISKTSIEGYTKYLANLRLRAIGLKEIFVAPSKSPYAHLERMGMTGNDNATKANFFESGVTSYQMSSTVKGWDF